MLYLYRLIPPRSTFPADMTADEGAAMQRHFDYWQKQMNNGTAVVVGPVADPQGFYGIAVLDVSAERHAVDIVNNDPVLTAALGFNFSLCEMPNTLVRPKRESK